MAREFTTKLSPKRAASLAAPIAVPALARLARVLARQAARELLTPDLPGAEEKPQAQSRVKKEDIDAYAKSRQFVLADKQLS